MLAKRIIPILLYRNGNLVKGQQFISGRVVGNCQQAAEIHQAREVDELIVLDVAASPANKPPDFAAMRRLTQCCFMPITVGGGVSEVSHVRDLLAGGADKVVIGTAAVKDPFFIAKCADKFGSQAIVVSVDILASRNKWILTSNCGIWRRDRHDITPLDFIKDMVKRGAGEIMINSVNRDGMMNGYDLRFLRRVVNEVDVPIIIAGGCGSYAHMRDALRVGADAVAAGALFQFTDCTPRGAAEYLQKYGIEVRL
jgi:cyclase